VLENQREQKVGESDALKHGQTENSDPRPRRLSI